MSSASNYDTSKLLIDFSQCPKGVRLVDHFNQLKTYTEFTQQQDDNIIKIAILTSDADSPFWKLRGDREIMIKSIFYFLDIGTNNLKAKEFFNSVLNYKNEAVAECWSAYLQMQYNVDFSDWSITKQTYDMLISESNRQKEDGESTEKFANWRVSIRNQIRKLGEDLKEIEPKIFKDSKMAQPVGMAEIKKIKGYPEKYARTVSHV